MVSKTISCNETSWIGSWDLTFSKVLWENQLEWPENVIPLVDLEIARMCLLMARRPRFEDLLHGSQCCSEVPAFSD
jgi:hypothetical protein